MDKFIVKDTRCNFEDAESIEEALQMAEDWMEEALEAEDTEMSVGIYQLVKIGKFVKDDGATEDYLADCKNDGVIPEYEYIVKSVIEHVNDMNGQFLSAEAIGYIMDRVTKDLQNINVHDGPEILLQLNNTFNDLKVENSLEGK